MCQTKHPFANLRFGYWGQTFKNEVRTALRTAGRDTQSPKTALFWDIYKRDLFLNILVPKRLLYLKKDV